MRDLTKLPECRELRERYGVDLVVGLLRLPNGGRYESPFKAVEISSSKRHLYYVRCKSGACPMAEYEEAEEVRTEVGGVRIGYPLLEWETSVDALRKLTATLVAIEKGALFCGAIARGWAWQRGQKK